MKEIAQNSNVPAFVAEFRSIAKPNTYTDLIGCTSAKLRPFAAKYGNDALETIVSGVLSSISSGLGLPVNAEQVLDASTMIIQEYPDTKLSDFILFKNEVLMGRVGGQVDNQLWKWTTRTMFQAWAEYYAKREDAFCDYREQKIQEDKLAYQNGFVESYRNASPETKKMIQDTTAKLEALAEARRAKYEEEKQIIPSKLTLEEIARSEGVDFSELAEAIQKRAELRDPSVLISVRLAAEMASVTFYARQNPKYLHEILKAKK